MAGSLLLLTAPADAGSDRLAAYEGPPSKPKPCESPVPGTRGIRVPGTARQDTLCGSRGPDEFIAVGGGDVIEGYDGADVIMARNGKPDEVWGGLGSDRGRFDPCDVPNVMNVEKVSVAGRCPGVAPRSLQRRNGDAPITPPVVECYRNAAGERIVDILVEPQVRALDVTGHVDFQTIAWSPVLLVLENDDWKIKLEHNWYWDRTYDEQVREFAGNYWRSFSHGVRTFPYFVPDQPGVYAIGARIHWYPERNAPARDELVDARAHYGPHADKTIDACVFEA